MIQLHTDSNLGSSPAYDPSDIESEKLARQSINPNISSIERNNARIKLEERNKEIDEYALYLRLKAKYE